MKKIFLLFIYFSMFYVISNDAIAQSPFEEFGNTIMQKLDEQSAYQDTQIQESNVRLYKLQQELSEQRQDIIKKQLEYEKQFRERMHEIYPYIAMIPVGVDYHYVGKSYDDREFKIDWREYEATGYCFDMRRGDPVIFVDSKPDLCTSAQILNLRTMRGCRVWCK